jgi:hypothetical protein
MFMKGQSGNPSGRPKMAPEVRDAIRDNGKLAVMRMSDLLMDDSAFGKFGWIKPREQILLLAAAQERAFGKPLNIAVDHHHGGSKPASLSDRLARIADQLPERRSQRAVLDKALPEADVVENLPPPTCRR